MENFYLIIVVILFALAISDLIVGVTNDAVNFLNSAIGSKAAPKWVIYSMAALGVLIGATFSTGMMEVARKGVFFPEMFCDIYRTLGIKLRLVGKSLYYTYTSSVFNINNRYD